jgi:hypothetical protein
MQYNVYTLKNTLYYAACKLLTLLSLGGGPPVVRRFRSVFYYSLVDLILHNACIGSSISKETMQTIETRNKYIKIILELKVKTITFSHFDRHPPPRYLLPQRRHQTNQALQPKLQSPKLPPRMATYHPLEHSSA